jgi:hypothetical protein
VQEAIASFKHLDFDAGYRKALERLD